MSESEHSDRVDLYLFVSDLVKGSLMTTTLTARVSVPGGEEPVLTTGSSPAPTTSSCSTRLSSTSSPCSPTDSRSQAKTGGDQGLYLCSLLTVEYHQVRPDHLHQRLPASHLGRGACQQQGEINTQDSVFRKGSGNNEKKINIIGPLMQVAEYSRNFMVFCNA